AEVAADRPVFVTTTGLVPRLMWHGLEDQRWLVVRDGSALPEVIDRLRAQGVSTFVLVTPRLAHYRPGLEGAVEVSSAFGAGDGEGWQVRVFRVT
ncbi:MAG: hypothetical protein M3179_02195, partial [Actinomycetota bacterium]|nr:hypothetical protein [Actinomycetota bacterium]